MKKFVKEHKELVQSCVAILGIVIVIVIAFIASDHIGDRSLDKNLPSTSTGKTEEKEENPLLEDGQVLNEEEMKEIEEITYEDFQAYLKKKSTTVVMLGYDECYWCKLQKPILQNVMYEKEVDVKYLNVHKLTNEQLSEIIALHDDLKELGTPTFISVKSKKVQQVSPNAKTKTELIKMLADMKVIK